MQPTDGLLSTAPCASPCACTLSAPCLPLSLPLRLAPAVRVPLYPFAARVRDYSEMARRYTHMFVAPDMVRVVFAWAQVRGF